MKKRILLPILCLALLLCLCPTFASAEWEDDAALQKKPNTASIPGRTIRNNELTALPSGDVFHLISPIGTLETLCLMVDFPDYIHDDSYTTNDLAELLKNDVRNMYSAISFAHLDTRINVAPSWYTA